MLVKIKVFRLGQLNVLQKIHVKLIKTSSNYPQIATKTNPCRKINLSSKHQKTSTKP